MKILYHLEVLKYEQILNERNIVLFSSFNSIVFNLICWRIFSNVSSYIQNGTIYNSY